MNNINNLLNIGKNTIQEQITMSNTQTKQSFNSSFEDLLLKNNPKKQQFVSQSISSKHNNISVYTISSTSLTKYGKKVVSELNKFLSTENNKDTIKTTLKKIHSILNKSLNSTSNNQEFINVDENIDDASISDIINVCELENSTIESMQAILALLNQQQYNTSNIELGELSELVVLSELGLTESLGENFNLVDADNSNDLLVEEETINFTDELFNTINSIENKLMDVFNETALCDNAEVTDDFMQKLMSLVQSDTDLSNSVNLSQKEEMLETSNNLNISSVFANSFNSIDMIEDITNIDMHPITKQVLSSIQAQISTVNLDNKTVELRLKLFPSKLGAISVILEHDSDGLRITLQSDNADVRSLLSSSIGDLQEQLNKFGNEVFIDVSSNNNNNKEANNENINSIENINNYIEEDLVKIDSDINLINKILDIKL